jgi:ribosomal protein S18 acetylase RimI-like enzyme
VSDADIVFTVVDPRCDEAQRALRAYIAEVVTNITEPSLRLHHAEQVDEYEPPLGAFVLATRGEATVACGAIRPFADENGVVEVKRMWVHPDARHDGLGVGMLAELERISREYGYTRARLDTNENLTAAIRMYERAGYERVERFNNTPDATHFYEKRL